MTQNRHHFRIAEIFGPTIQGEGRTVGAPCHFVRFGGCDYRCTWCDTPHAVLTENVNQLEKFTEWQIVHILNTLDELAGMSPTWVVITGGNPALLNLSELIDLLHKQGRKVMLETQGSVFREWFGKVDDLCFSPKPPSSTMEFMESDFDRIIEATIKAQNEWAVAEGRGPFLLPYLKVPVFTDEDFEFAAMIHAKYQDLEFFLSIGNDDPSLPTVGNPHPKQGAEYPTTEHILNNQLHWTEKMLKDQRFDHVRIFSQQHVLLWGNARGH